MSHPQALRDIALFVEVAKRGSFSRAAAALDMPISSLSRRIMLFEAAVGLRLIERTTRKLTLTPHGETYLPRAALLVEEAERTVEEMVAQAKGPSVLLRVAVPSQSWVMHAIVRALAEAELPAGVRLQFDITATDSAPEDRDLAITVGKPEVSVPGSRPLGALETALYASPSYLDRRGTPSSPDDLDGHDAIVVGHALSAEWRLQRGGSTMLVRVGGRIACASADLVRPLAVAGLGIVAASPVEIEDDLREARLVRVLPGWRLPATPVHAFESSRALPPEARRLLERLTEPVGARADADRRD